MQCSFFLFFNSYKINIHRVIKVVSALIHSFIRSKIKVEFFKKEQIKTPTYRMKLKKNQQVINLDWTNSLNTF